MFRCSFCDRWWDRLWQRTDAWERAASNESDLRDADSDRNRELIDRAFSARESDPARALQLFLEAAEAGSAYAMHAAAIHYDRGDAAPRDPDKALDFYHRAICAGSWMATLHYARLLAELGHRADWEQVLAGGVAMEFVPSFFWLAYLRFKEDRSRAVARECRLLLEHAAGQGHPAARVILAKYMTLGRFGLRAIPAGLVLGFRVARAAADEESAR
jgi:TPR repeat protein